MNLLILIRYIFASILFYYTFFSLLFSMLLFSLLKAFIHYIAMASFFAEVVYQSSLYLNCVRPNPNLIQHCWKHLFRCRTQPRIVYPVTFFFCVVGTIEMRCHSFHLTLSGTFSSANFTNEIEIVPVSSFHKFNSGKPRFESNARIITYYYLWISFTKFS